MSDSDDRDFLKVDPETAWLETITIGGFRIWHIIAICLGILLTLVVMVCCCIRFRIPRTKQEIEADYQRKQITKKFREKLQQIKNSDMDDMDLQKANVSPFNYNYSDIYSDTSALVPPPEAQQHYQHHHEHHCHAWQEHHQHSIVSLSIMEAGYIALQHVAKDVITHQCSGDEGGCRLLRQSHIVYPATTYRHKRETPQFFIEYPMVHRVAQSNKYNAKNYRNGNEPPKRYQFIGDKYEDFNNNNSSDEVYENPLNILEDEHPVYGCNL